MRTLSQIAVRTTANRERACKAVTVCGLGNIGSNLPELLARIPDIERVTFVDSDRYEATNLASQKIRPSDLKRSKAKVAAARFSALNSRIQVEAMHGDIANVPLERLRCGIFISCLDSIGARAVVNRIVWRLQIPCWLDCGVATEHGLVRITRYSPLADDACFECALSEHDLLPAKRPCGGAIDSVTPTNGNAALGALAAARAAIEIEKLVSAAPGQLAAGCQLVVDTRNHQCYITKLPRNRTCRFDHRAWRIQSLGRLTLKASLGKLIQRIHRRFECATSLQFEGKAFIKELFCLKCGASRKRFHVAGRLGRAAQCPRCRAPMESTGFKMVERLALPIPPQLARLSLRSIGLCAGDVFTIRNQSNHEFHLGL